MSANASRSYAQSQRFVALSVVARNATCVTLDVPEAPALIPGRYLLFLLSDVGAPSIGVVVNVTLGVGDSPWSIDDASAPRTAAPPTPASTSAAATTRRALLAAVLATLCLLRQ